MFISALMTLASLLGIFLIHYQNTTVYSKQLLIEAPKPVSYVIPTYTPSNVIEEICDSIDLDLVDYDDDEDEPITTVSKATVSQATVSQPSIEVISSLLPFSFITTYIIALMCVQSKITAARLTAKGSRSKDSTTYNT